MLKRTRIVREKKNESETPNMVLAVDNVDG
jgi:hypothetical protein